MWVEFHECVHKTKHTTHVVCKHCSKSYTHPGCVGKAEEGGTTRSMSRHLIKCTSYNTKKNKEKISDFTSRMEKGQTILDDYDNASIVDKVLKFFISGNIAFNQADNPYFQDLIRHAEARAPDPKINRKSVRTRLTQVGQDAKEDLMITLIENDSKISLALDCWTSKNGHAFLGNILISYISASLLSNISFCMLHIDSDYSYNQTLD
jgi:hypothetical protein